MIPVTSEDLASRLPRDLDTEEWLRAGVLLEDAIAEVEDAITDAGYDLTVWLESSRNVRRAQRVVRAMVAVAILTGEDVGKASWSVATGPYNESITYASVAPVALWGEVELSTAMLSYLNLGSAPVEFSFPAPDRWPEVRRPWSR